MRFGVVVLPTDPWPETAARAQRLEALGFDHLWLYDHLTWRRYRDRSWFGIYPWLAALAAVTERIGLGTMVTNPNIRHPVTLAKDAMAIDHVSNGRFRLGIGAGGVGFDATAFGQDPLTPAQRIDRLGEFVEVVDGLLRSELTDHDGPWYTVNEARMIPGCVQQPRLPVAVAAGKAKGLAVAARWGDAWITNGDTSRPDLDADTHHRIVAQQVDAFHRACEAEGRDPDTIDRIILLTNAEGRPLGSIDAFAAEVDLYRELGFTDLVFHHPRPDDPTWDDPVEILDEIAQHYHLDRHRQE